MGVIAQLGERYNGIVEAIGSIPINSTKIYLRSSMVERRAYNPGKRQISARSRFDS